MTRNLHRLIWISPKFSIRLTIASWHLFQKPPNLNWISTNGSPYCIAHRWQWYKSTESTQNLSPFPGHPSELSTVPLLLLYVLALEPLLHKLRHEEASPVLRGVTLPDGSRARVSIFTNGITVIMSCFRDILTCHFLRHPQRWAAVGQEEMKFLTILTIARMVVTE